MSVINSPVENQKVCQVFLNSAEAMAKCVKVLNGMSWKGRTLGTKMCKKFVSVQSIPSSVTEEELNRELQLILGSDLQIVTILCKFDSDMQHKTAYLRFTSGKSTIKAQAMLNGVSLWGNSLRAEYFMMN